MALDISRAFLKRVASTAAGLGPFGPCCPRSFVDGFESDLWITVGAVSCLSAVHPGVAVKLRQGVWRYLSSTRFHGVHFRPFQPVTSD